MLLGLAFLAQVGEAQQPAQRHIPFRRQQGGKLHAQAALVDITKLNEFQR